MQAGPELESRSSRLRELIICVPRFPLTHTHTIIVCPSFDLGFLKPEMPANLGTLCDGRLLGCYLDQVAKVVGSNFSLQRAEHVLCHGQTMGFRV